MELRGAKGIRENYGNLGGKLGEPGVTRGHQGKTQKTMENCKNFGNSEIRGTNGTRLNYWNHGDIMGNLGK